MATRTALRSTPLLVNQAPPSGIFYEHAKRLGNGGIRVEIGYDTSHAPETGLEPVKQKVLLQTPRLRRATPVFSEKYGKKWSCLCSLGGWEDESSEVKALHDWIQDMDAQTQAMCKKRCMEWFRKQLQEHQYAEYYTSSIKPDQSGQYPPSLKASLPFRNDKPEFDVWGPNREKSSLQEWQEHSKGSEAVLIVEFSSVYFAARMYGIAATVRAVQYFPKDILTGYSFVATPAIEAGQERDPEEEESLRQALAFAGGAGPPNAPSKRPREQAPDGAAHIKRSKQEDDDEEEPLQAAA